MKLCAKCKQDKPRSEFYFEPRTSSGLSSWCKECNATGSRERYKHNPKNAEAKRARGRKWRAENKGWVKSYQQNWHKENRDQQLKEFFKGRLRRKYGLSFEDYKALSALQGDCCAICKKPEKLVVDHDHITGKVRGLICDTHNKGLGFFHDSPDDLELAAAYLRKFRG